MGAAQTRTANGQYRRWNSVTLAGRLLVSKRPLAVTRLNEAAVDIIGTLGPGEFRSPQSVARETNQEVEAVASLLERLHRRGFLEWRPARDPTHLPPVSVVVTVRNAQGPLSDCLDAFANLTYPTYEVVVVEDGSTDGTVEAAANHPFGDDDRLRVLSVGSATEPIGIGASRNRGVDAARYDIVAFTDVDCRPQADWLSDLVPCLIDHDLVGGRVRPAGDATASMYEGHNSSLDMGPYASRIDPGGDTPYLATANLVGRRAVFETVPFPERDIAEDVELCWRALDAGFDVVYTPSGVVEHSYRTGVREFVARRSAYGRSEALLARDHGRDDADTIGISTLTVLVVGIAFVAVTVSGVASTVALVSAGTLVALAAVSRGGQLWQRYRRLSPVVSVSDVARSWLRERLSSAYAVSREVTRYYSGPMVLIGTVGWLAGVRGFATVLLVGVIAAGTLPLVVEYRVRPLEVGPAGYAVYYLADHLGYQSGVYRGALSYRTFSHLTPTGRFRVIGPGSGLLARLVPDRPERTTIRVGDTTARFSVDSAAANWWFEDMTLRGERPVLCDLLGRLDSDDVFFDVGANVGLYSCLVGRALDSGETVSFEPHSTTADQLAENLSRNDVDGEVRRTALGAENRCGHLRSPAADPSNGEHELVQVSTPMKVPTDWGRKVVRGRNSPSGTEVSGESVPNDALRSTNESLQVPVVEGDSLVAAGEVPQPTVLKIDVEGAEDAVIDGLEATIADPVCRLVYCELHPEALRDHGSSPETVRTRLRTAGFATETIQELTDGRSIVRGWKGSREDGSDNAGSTPCNRSN